MTGRPRIRAVASASAAYGLPWRADLEELLYLRDLYAPFGVPLHEDRLRSGGTTTHRELVRSALDGASAAAEAARNADLVVIAGILPDLHPFDPVGAYVQRRLESPGLGFTVSGQGTAAPFTALRTAAAFQRAGRARTSIVVIVEQATHPDPAGAPVADRAAAGDGCVLLVLDGEEDGAERPGAAGGMRIEDVCRVRADSRAAGTRLLEAEVDRHTRGAAPGEVLVVLGPHVPPDLRVPDTAAVIRVDRPGYGTGVWLEFAAHHTAWAAAHRRIVLCEADARRPGHGDLLLLSGGPARA
ncbi:hypothetical protein [Streptomyces sp. NPDC056670]|uniref:hypothetical protein n=1 Tax=Streptomyces sp. NPDC056670 TaxID=3345904 RepID=UPI0036CB67A3